MGNTNLCSYTEQDFDHHEWCTPDCKGHKISLQHLSTSNQYKLMIDDQEVWLTRYSLEALQTVINQIYK